MKYDAIVLMLISSMFTILGILIGGYLNHKSAKELFSFQQNRELKIRTYSKLMGLKMPLVQTIQTTVEAKMLCEYYDARFKFISKDRADLDEAKSQNERMLATIPQVSALKRELFEELGNVKISFDVSTEMSVLIDKIYKHQGIDVSEISAKDGEVIDNRFLDDWKSKTMIQIQDYLNENFLSNFEGLLPLMSQQIKED